MTTTDQQIAALKRERAGYVARGLDARAAQVDEELARLQDVPGPGDDTQAPQGRSGPESQQQTAAPATPQQTGNVGATAPAKKTAAKKTAAAPPTE